MGRPQTMGKIKVGKKGPRGNPMSIKTFRFVSRDHDAIQRLAATYGGRPVKVDDQWDLESEANEIGVILPPDPLGGTPIYELWSRAGCLRRCDGLSATVPHRSGDDVDLIDVPCICAANDAMECKPTVRLSVILPEVALAGVWALKTNSWAAAREMQQMVSMVELAQSQGLVAAALAIEPREQVTGGQTKKFVVPVLKLKATLAELAQGGTVALGMAPAVAAIEAPRTELSESERHQLNVAWREADEVARTEAATYLESHGMTPHTVSPGLLGDLLDILVVHEPDEP